jgi:hypothetical protein
MIKRIITKSQRVVLLENNFSKSFSLSLILSYLDINIPDNASTLTHWSFSVFLFSLIALICFINVLFFLIVYILIQGKMVENYENKYPKLKKLINFYKKSSILYVIIESLICFSCLLLLIIFSILYVFQGIS